MIPLDICLAPNYSGKSNSSPVADLATTGPVLNRDIEHPFPLPAGTRLTNQRPHGKRFLNFEIADGPRKGLRVTVIAEAVTL